MGQQWEALLARFQEICEVTKTLPDHSKLPPPPQEPEYYDPRTDPEVLANGMSLEDARARAVPVPDLRLPRSLKDSAKKAIRALQPHRTARKPI